VLADDLTNTAACELYGTDLPIRSLRHSRRKSIERLMRSHIFVLELAALMVRLGVRRTSGHARALRAR
jgi:hypothetical protein